MTTTCSNVLARSDCSRQSEVKMPLAPWKELDGTCHLRSALSLSRFLPSFFFESMRLAGCQACFCDSDQSSRHLCDHHKSSQRCYNLFSFKSSYNVHSYTLPLCVGTTRTLCWRTFPFSLECIFRIVYQHLSRFGAGMGQFVPFDAADFIDAYGGIS